VKKVITPAGELGTEILGIRTATIAQAASLTAGLILTPANDPDALGCKSELDLGKLTQNPTQQDKDCLDFLRRKGKPQTTALMSVTKYPTGCWYSLMHLTQAGTQQTTDSSK
jgi:hypothetical protein